jgi:hypothetical protein
MNGKSPRHLAVWLDHHIARLLALSRLAVAEQIIHNEDSGAGGHVHHHAGTFGAGHAPIDKGFLEKISQAIGEAEEILILGPVEARSALKAFLDHHAPHQAKRVVGMEAMHPSGTAEIAAFAQDLFHRIDRMRPLH